MIANFISQKTLLIVFHATFIVLAYFSFLLFPWQIVLVGAVILETSYLIFGECILTKIQHKNEDKDFTFTAYLLERLGLKTNRRLVKILVLYVSPPVITVLAIILQKWLGVVPLLLI